MTHKFLVIQTAFTGDVVLATALVEKLHKHYPDAQLDFLLRKGNEALLTGHPYISNVLVWDKKNGKTRNLLTIIAKIRRQKYSHVINVHRFATSGLITFLSGARYKSGYDKNPFSFCYDKKVKHFISEPYANNSVHEVTRNNELITAIAGHEADLPKLYPQAGDYELVKQYQDRSYICIAPSSVWFTKQFPADKWASLIDVLPPDFAVYLIGAPSDAALGEGIKATTNHTKVVNLCGKLSFLQSAALMQSAEMNYTNDSAPLHFASAMNAPVTAIFCSTVPAFGFGPLRNNGRVVEIAAQLKCRPCGLHGHRQCPEGHFRCAKEITNEQLLWWTSKTT